MTLKVTQGLWNCHNPINTNQFPLRVSNNNVCTVYETSPHLQCTNTWLPVTPRSPEIQATFGFWFMCKHIVVNTCYMWDTVVGKVSSSKWTSRSLKVIGNGVIWWAMYDLQLVFHCNYIPILQRPQNIISYFPQELIRRWDSERKLFTTISHTYFKTKKQKRELTSFNNLDDS